MIRYKKYQMTGENHPLKGLWYARPLIEDTFDTEKLAKHMSNHNTPYSAGLIKGALTHTQARPQAPTLDGKKVAARAGKRFRAEVSEEGLARVDDQTAREAARRAFRCAEFFRMEESRRKQSLKAVSQQGRNASQEEDRDAEEATGEE
mgnify:CR=1 FL=1